MASILTFLGKGGSGRTTVAIATARKLANLGARVLLVEQDPSPSPVSILGADIGTHPTDLAPNLKAVQLSSTVLLEQGWEQIKELEAQYLRTPTLKGVFGQELGILPGMDSALALNALREYDSSGHYDAIVYDGTGDLATLRMFGIPEVLDWYVRRFRKVLEDSDIVKTLSPFVQPVTGAIFSTSWSGDSFVQQPADLAKNILTQGKAALADPQRLAAYLVTTEDPLAIATAKYLWGSAQQVGLAVKGAILNRSDRADALASEFEPLNLLAVPQHAPGDLQIAIDALPDLRQPTNAPLPVTVDMAAREVRVFLPGFDKKQVKLTQYGPEITIDAGSQRHNLDLPAALRGQSVRGAKFQQQYLVISF